MDDDDLEKLLFDGDIRGTHTIAGWEVHRSGVVDPRYDRLVSIHEALHDQLHGSTGYGGLLHILAYLQRNGEEQLAPLLATLVQRCRRTHEAYATYLSLLVLGGGRLDLSLLGDNPRYRAYAGVAEAIAGPLRGGFLRYQAAAASLRACLQSDLIDRVAEVGLASFTPGLLPQSSYPDGLLERVLSTPMDWHAVVDRCRAEHPALAGWDEVMRSEDDPNLYSELVQGAYDATSDALLVAMHDEVRRKIPGILGFNEHRRTLPRLLEQAFQLVPPERARRPLHMAPTEEAMERDMLASFAEERSFLRENPLPLDVKPLPEQVAELVCGEDGLEHLYVVAMPVHRLREQHRVVGALPAGPLITGLQRVVVFPDGERRVHFYPLPSAEVLLAKLSQLHEGHPVLACASLLAYGDAAWCEEWLGALRGATLFTVLVDNDPFRHLDIWARQEGLVMRYAGMQLPPGAPLYSVVALRPDGAPELFLVPCSISLDSALATLLSGPLPAGHGLVQDTGFLERADRGALSLLLGHLLGEAWTIDFRAAEGYAPAKEAPP